MHHNTKINETMKEIWKPIPKYEGIYEVSNHGKVRRLLKNHGEVRYSPLKALKGGYIHLTTGNLARHIKVIQVVAEAFIESPYDGAKARMKNKSKGLGLDNIEYIPYHETLIEKRDTKAANYDATIYLADLEYLTKSNPNVKGCTIKDSLKSLKAAQSRKKRREETE